MSAESTAALGFLQFGHTASLTDGAHLRGARTRPERRSDAGSRSFTVTRLAPHTIDSGPSGPTSDATPFSTGPRRADRRRRGAVLDTRDHRVAGDGAHTFEVARRSGGNVDPTRRELHGRHGRRHTIEADRRSTSDATPTFAFSSDQGGSSFECRVDGGAWGSCSTPETTASLADGAHTFEVRATDPAGNVDSTPASRSFTVDTAAPQTAIDSGPFGSTSDATPTFMLSSDQAGSTFECRVDGGAWASCSPVHTTAALGDGPHTLEVRATDPAGNVDATPASWAFTVDTAAPQTTIDSGPSGPTSDVTPTFAFSADQVGSTFECRVDGGAWGPCSTPETTSSLADGSHTFEVRATDLVGNVDPTPASRTFTVDTAAPDTTIDSGPSGPTSDATPTFAFSASQAGSSFECRVDGGAWGSCSTPETTGSLTDGAHTFEARATDPAGNVDSTPASRSFTVDTAAPQTTIDSGPSDPTADATPTFAFSSDQPGSTFECRIDGGAWASCSSSHTTAALGDGPHTFEVRTTDPAGNTDATPAQHAFVVETGPPDTTIDSGPSGATNDPTPTFGFSANEAGSSFECRVDGGAWGSCSTPETTGSLTDGAHTFEVRATDLAGNVDPTPASRSFTVDTAAPDTTIDSGPSGPTSDATPTFAFSASQPGSTFECRVDAGAWASCSSSHTTAALSDGPHTFEVRTTDPAGNVDPTPASRSFTVDTTGPDTSIDSGPSGPTSDSTPTFAFSADQAGSSFECRIDGGAWGSCSTPDTAASLADGAHTFEVRATDPVGNVDPTPASRSFTVDTAAPNTTIDSGPSGPTNDATPTFVFSASQPGSTFECRVDGGAWVSCGSPYTTAALPDGPHTFEVRTTDPAGNVDPTPASLSFTVATAVPNPPPVTPNNPPPKITPSVEPPPPTSDLSALAGSLVGDRSCQRLGAGLRTKRLKVRGIGRVTVRIQASAIVLADAALQFSVTGPRSGKGRLRSVGYTLDGRRMRGSGRQPFTLAITPAALARVGRHALTLKLKPRRGRAGTVKLGMRTFPCKTVFRAYQKRTAGGSQLKLRIDARDAISGATFSVPGKMLPKGKARLKVGTIRVVSTSGGSRSWSLAFGAKPAAQLFVAGVGAPSVILRGNQVIVGGLPAGSGIVEVILNTKRSTRPTALVSPRRSAGLRATVTGASAQRLSYKLRGRR